jgi:hypothetical protein
LPEIIFPDAVLADGLNLESLDSVITFHTRMCNAEGCNGPCNHDGKIITGASFDSDYDEDDHGPSDHLDDEDDTMELVPVTASKPASEEMIVGAALIKKLAGSKKSEESSTCFFPK